MGWVDGGGKMEHSQSSPHIFFVLSTWATQYISMKMCDRYPMSCGANCLVKSIPGSLQSVDNRKVWPNQTAVTVNMLLFFAYPTSNGGMQNGSSVGIGTCCIHVFARFAPICMLSRCFVTKFLQRRSVRTLLRMCCRLGSQAAVT